LARQALRRAGAGCIPDEVPPWGWSLRIICGDFSWLAVDVIAEPLEKGSSKI